MRLFIALSLPDEAREQLSAIQGRMRELALPLRTARAEGLHITLAFLGETPEDRVGPIRAAMQDASAGTAPFRVALAGLGTFPNQRRPRVLWAGLTGDIEALATLHARLNDRLTAAELPAEARSFRPHVTLGRATADWAPAQLTALRELLTHPPAGLHSWVARDLHLMRSELGRAGARYTTLYTCPLKG